MPVPSASLSIVEHVLYLGGKGRESPFQSTTESEDAAEVFAGTGGKVYRTTAARAAAKSVGHISRVELLGLLKGKGKGRAKWSSALEVMTARKYVEQWAEHLLDFAEIPEDEVADAVEEIYAR